ncbi:MAG TPA: ABC transporter substrate-binding protein, partial [Acetobacteraceae bacterium]|nr:ABC transporter substrate-binding protein [Acetobacteraceae bacterium]
SGSNAPVIMPERLAKTDPFTQVTEMVGSGPYKFVANERVPGSLVVYERNPDYVPRSNGRPSFTAGPKIVHFDRVEWHVIPDAATAAAALQSGEMDWWETPTADLLPLLHRDRQITIEIQDPTGDLGCMRPNFLYPPFDNVAFRRALMGAVDQRAFMTAAAGTDPTLSHVPAGVFCPVSPLASDAGMPKLVGEPDYAAVRRAIAASGYKGEKIVVLGATDFPIIDAACNVGLDMLKKAGLHVDYVATDWGTLVERRGNKAPPENGGWNVFFTYWGGLDMFSPAADASIRGNGDAGWFGWPKFPDRERLREAWFASQDLPTQKKIASEIQVQFFKDVPFYPLGQLFNPIAYRDGVSGILDGGFVLFWNVHKS